MIEYIHIYNEGAYMLSLSVSQAQRQFTSLLGEVTTVIDKKSNVKKAVILPYEMYEKLIEKSNNGQKSEISEFLGILSEDFVTDDERYNDIVK